MNLVEKLRNGCVQAAKRWSGDCGEFSTVDEAKTDELMREAADRIEVLTVALAHIRDTPYVVYEPVRQIAMEALK